MGNAPASSSRLALKDRKLSGEGREEIRTESRVPRPQYGRGTGPAIRGRGRKRGSRRVLRKRKIQKISSGDRFVNQPQFCEETDARNSVDFYLDASIQADDLEGEIQLFDSSEPSEWIVDRMSKHKVCAELIKRGFDPYNGLKGRNEASKDDKEVEKWDTEAKEFLKNLIRKKIPAGLLINLLQENDLEGFDLLLEQNADINGPDHRGSRPIHVICEQEDLKDISDANHLERLADSLSFLLSRKADVNVCNNVGMTPLVMCAQAGWYRGVHLLLNNGADVELSAEGNFTPLFESAQGGHVDCLKLLVRHGANVNVVAGNQMTPVWVAAYHGRDECVAYLLDHGADASLKHDGHTARDAAKLNGHERVIKLFDRTDKEQFQEFESEEDFRKFLKKQSHREMENRRKRLVWESSPEKHCVHGLRVFVTDHEYICDVCEEPCLENTVMYGCRICNWDQCEACAHRPGRDSDTAFNSNEALLTAPGMFTERKDERVRTVFLSRDIPGSPGEPEAKFRFNPTDRGPDIILSDIRDPGKEPDLSFSEDPDFDHTQSGPDIVLSDLRLYRTDSGPDLILQAVPGESHSELEAIQDSSTDTCGEPDLVAPGSLRTNDSDSFGEPDIVISEIRDSEMLKSDEFDGPTPNGPDVVLSPVVGEI